ncbi:hypothetical protein [Microvirga arabica]|uniref:hypothetical protein n=1 Tax=Microvirga arabica TaxID=1128671 RepID=UPI00193A524C|nr:hypothetical protein [Microvirga arabica]MBM1169964.1 hypothetical protein [Microvirga arabica]
MMMGTARWIFKRITGVGFLGALIPRERTALVTANALRRKAILHDPYARPSMAEKA